VTSLYARVFLSFWAVMIAIVAGAIVVTGLVLTQRAEELPRVSTQLVREAAAALREGGEPRLVEWLKTARVDVPGVSVLVFDSDGRELLGRRLPRWLEQRVRRDAGEPTPGEPTPGGPGPGELSRSERSAADEPGYADADHWRDREMYWLPDGIALALPEFAPPPGTPLGVRILAPQPVPVLVTPDGREYGILVLPPISRLGPFGIPETRWAVFLLALVVTGVASWLLTRSITAPVGALGAATRALAAGDLDARVHGTVGERRDELGVLARDFDAMAARLRELLHGKERLLRDISHELRSPLARMRVALGLARQPGADQARQLDRLEAEAERLDALIGHVLHLSRLDARATRLRRDPVELGELVDGIARDAAYEAQARGVRVVWHAPEAPVRVLGDPPLLASAVENVVRNAVRYTADGTAVEIAVVADAAFARVTVRDRGPGVPESELGRIFEPFYRVTESRDRDSGGDGIGLAITSRVLAAHDGTARAANRAGGGLEVTLEVPLA
jgi:two-component system sensor histidine kinase CpxA